MTQIWGHPAGQRSFLISGDASCAACAQAEVNPATGSVASDCGACMARWLAGSPYYFEAARQQKRTGAYNAALRRIFGHDWLAAHEEVKAWARRIAEHKKKGLHAS